MTNNVRLTYGVGDIALRFTISIEQDNQNWWHFHTTPSTTLCIKNLALIRSSSFFNFYRQKVDRPMPKHMRQLTTWQVFYQVERKLRVSSVQTWPMIQLPSGDKNNKEQGPRAMNKENQPLVPDEPVEFKKWMVEVRDFRNNTNHF